MRTASSMSPTRALLSRMAGLTLAALLIANSFYSYFWAIALPPVQARTIQSIQSPGCAHEKSTCQCVRCAGPSKCPCDHGMPSPGSSCEASHEEPPLSAQDSTTPVPAKMMCEIPHRPTSPEVWTPRFELALHVSIHPYPDPVDKVPIL